MIHINFLHDGVLKMDDHILSFDMTVVRDLGVHLSTNLQWSSHCAIVSHSAMRVVNCILRSLQFRCVLHFLKAFIVYCRLLLEYCLKFGYLTNRLTFFV